MRNNWNKAIYKLWSPVYDHFFNSGKFLQARKKVFDDFPFSKNEKILFVGVGTGADLEFFRDPTMSLTAIDYSPDMIEIAKRKFQSTSINFIEMDAQNLEFEDESFDTVVASLVLSVVPNPETCLNEMMRVLRNGGKLLIFDKFAPKNKELSKFIKLIRPVVALLGTDIGISFEHLYVKQQHNLKLTKDTPVMLNGMYRKILLLKN